LGKLEIVSFNQNGSICIKFKDDGRGIQVDKLISIAIESGKYKKSTVEKWSKKKLMDTIFESGISTADTVSTSAGRGVGMRLIKEKIDSYKGKIEIDTRKGEFCEFSILLPI
jgi:two-component system, chemotaxis family, sensor kinase CheA